MVVCVLLALASHHTRDLLFITPTLIIFLREFIISGFREYMSKKGVLISVSLLAKWKTTFQITSIGFIILSMIFSGYYILTYTSIALFWLAAIITVQTGIQYLRSGLSKLDWYYYRFLGIVNYFHKPMIFILEMFQQSKPLQGFYKPN